MVRTLLSNTYSTTKPCERNEQNLVTSLGISTKDKVFGDFFVADFFSGTIGEDRFCDCSVKYGYVRTQFDTLHTV